MKNYICESCKYYVPHYIRTHTAYKAICGHCTHNSLIYKRLKFELRESCEYWEDGNYKKEERKETIKETLREMKKHLAYIADILSKEG